MVCERTLAREAIVDELTYTSELMVTLKRADKESWWKDLEVVGASFLVGLPGPEESSVADSCNHAPHDRSHPVHLQHEEVVQQVRVTLVNKMYEFLSPHNNLYVPNLTLSS